MYKTVNMEDLKQMLQESHLNFIFENDCYKGRCGDQLFRPIYRIWCENNYIVIKTFLEKSVFRITDVSDLKKEMIKLEVI